MHEVAETVERLHIQEAFHLPFTDLPPALVKNNEVHSFTFSRIEGRLTITRLLCFNFQSPTLGGDVVVEKLRAVGGNVQEFSLTNYDVDTADLPPCAVGLFRSRVTSSAPLKASDLAVFESTVGGSLSGECFCLKLGGCSLPPVIDLQIHSLHTKQPLPEGTLRHVYRLEGEFEK
jgi:hypothetical protein